MKFTLAWLRDHLETDAALSDITETLTAIGLEVDSVTDPGAALAPFTAARVISAEQHPDADRLRVCQVESTAGTFQVVCGAPNARTGMVGVFAPVGTYVPGTDLTLTPAKIRGVESHGMLVSEREMQLSDDHEGIIDLPADTEIGTPIATALGLDDPVIDIELTPNRPDCTGVRGIARDLAAAGLGTLKPLDRAKPVAGTFDSPVKWAISAEDTNACPYVVGRSFRGLTNGPSPRWMADRLRAIGLRPISALVDITNYVTVDLGRPLHVYDAAKLTGDTLEMRLAKPGEKMLALNGNEYAVDPTMTVIADTAGIHGIGGVMGGEETGCTATTTDMFLECALFAPVAVAATGRKLALDSDARYRFERGVDSTSADWGAEVAANLVLELCGGEVGRVVAAGAAPAAADPISFRPARVAALGGVKVADAEQSKILTDLGFEVSGNGSDLIVSPPPWRPDIHGEADLVEEVVRIYGLDKVPAVPMERTTPLPTPAIDAAQRRVSRARRALAAAGLCEAVTWSFMAREHAEHFGGAPAGLQLANPISSDLDVMRPSLLPNLILAAGRNADRGIADVGLFEIAPQYHEGVPGGQRTVASGIRRGRMTGPHWAAPARAVDAIDAKGDAMAALTAAGAPAANAQVTRDAPGWYHPGRSATLRLGKTVLATFGEIHPAALAGLDVAGPVVGFEVFLDAIPQPKRTSAARPPLHLSALQPVHRDFAFVVDATTEASALLQAVRGADKALISDAALFDVYTGKGIDDGKKSLAVEVTLQPTDATLTDEQIDAVAAKIVANVVKRTGAVLRG